VDAEKSFATINDHYPQAEYLQQQCAPDYVIEQLVESIRPKDVLFVPGRTISLTRNSLKDKIESLGPPFRNVLNYLEKFLDERKKKNQRMENAMLHCNHEKNHIPKYHPSKLPDLD